MILKVVLDTNVIISGILWKGIPNTLLKLAEDGKIMLFANPAMLKEIKDVILRPKFLPRINKSNITSEEIIEGLLNITNICADLNIGHVIKEDPDDDKVLSCAVACGAKYLITGDPHLLNISTYSGIDILTPRQFINILLCK